MKKKLFLLTTFIISFVMFSNSAMAAQELTCIYKIKGTEYFAFSQSSDGSKKFYTNDKSSEITDKNWELLENNPHLNSDYDAKERCGYATCSNKDIVRDASRYRATEISAAIDGNIEYKKCPNIASISKNITGTITQIELYDEVENKQGYPLYNKNNNLISENDSEGKTEIEKEAVTEKRILMESQEEALEIKKDYRFKCDYESYIIYIYNNDYIVTSSLYTPNGKTDFSFNELQEKVDNYGNCPLFIYTKGGETIGISGNNSNSIILKECTTPNGDTCENVIADSGVDEPDQIEVNSCKDLFSDDTIKEINKYLNYIKISVPILLLVFGITDFFRATFSGSEDDIKKHRDRFLKRIIAAIIVFLVPTFVNLVLKLGNTVWNDVINKESCITYTE